MGGEPLDLPPELLDVPHDHVNGGYLPGLSCRAHNRAEGASRSNQARGFFPVAAGADVRCQACGQPYHYAARACEMCGAHYHPSYGEQRTCGRACGRQLQQRNRLASGWLPRDQRPKPPRQPRKPGPVQSGEREPKNGWPSTAIKFYTCRYCDKQGISRANSHIPREVCPSHQCQLARIGANNLRVRNGLTQEAADAQMRVLVQAGNAGLELWRNSRRW
jgi:hypothetical protein